MMSIVRILSHGWSQDPEYDATVDLPFIPRIGDRITVQTQDNGIYEFKSLATVKNVDLTIMLDGSVRYIVNCSSINI